MSRRDEITEAAIRAASLLAEHMLQAAEEHDPQTVAKARALVAQGGHVEIGFAFAEGRAIVSIGVREAAGAFRCLGTVPVSFTAARRH